MKPTTSIRVALQLRQSLMNVGKNESAFSQLLLGSKTWAGPKDQRLMLAKAEGDGYMLSAFVSRVFGLFGRELTEAAVNAGTRQGQHKTRLTLKLPQRQILVCNEKPLLTESPFVNCVYIGANNKGYWNNYHTSLRFKDFIHALVLCSCIHTFKGMLASNMVSWAHCRCHKATEGHNRSWGTWRFRKRIMDISANSHRHWKSAKLCW